jgi:iron-sulfur cluster repair protein YtfE (RIC family)
VGQSALVSTKELSLEFLAATPIRDLVDRWPQLLELLTPFGLDLCCGGGHPLGEALELHGFDPADVLPRVARVLAGEE